MIWSPMYWTSCKKAWITPPEKRLKRAAHRGDRARVLGEAHMEKRILSEAEINDALADLPGWSVADGKLAKSYKFDSFAAALGWMVAVGVAADKMDHHPEWSNVYNRVEVKLVTHDLDNQISTLDVTLAEKMEQLAPRMA